MNKIENYSLLNGTSFHGSVIKTTPNELIKLAESLGGDYNSDNGGDDKTNFDFGFETDNGISFSVYDWKEYRSLDLSEVVTFHIGTHSKMDGISAKEELTYTLNK